jgi:hypothetical protein
MGLVSVSGKFIKVPNTWEVCLARCGAEGSTYRLALYLLDRATFTELVPLSTAALKRRGVSRASKWRALEQLRQAGLVAVEHRRGRPPLVKVRWRA